MTNFSPWVMLAGAPPPLFNAVAERPVDRTRSGSALRPHVLVVDDENLIADSVAEILNRNGYDAVARYSGMAALRYLDERHPDIVVTDVMLPDLDGVRLGISVCTLCPKARVVLFSGHAATAGLLESALLEGYPFEMLSKPVHPAQLLKALRAA